MFESEYQKDHKEIVNSVIINSEEVDRVESYKYLGTINDTKLNVSKNILRIS